MPLYRYECEQCGHEFRVLQQRGDDSVAPCPSCESTETHRLPSRVSVQFKGSGYYKTDRANKKSKVGTKGLSDKDTSETSSDNGAGKPKESDGSANSKADKVTSSDKSSKND